MPPSQPSTSPAQSAQRDRHLPAARSWRTPARYLLALYLCVLLALVCWCAPAAGRWQALTLQPVPDTGLIGSVIPAASSVVKEFLLFLILAFLLGIFCGPAKNPTSRLQIWPRTALALIASFLVATATRILLHAAPYTAPSLPATLLLGTACLWGSWLGVTWISTQHKGRWLLQQTLLTALILGGGVAGFAWLALAPERLEVAAAELSTADRRRLFTMFRENDPRKLPPDATSQLTLTEQDCNQLAAWALSLLPGNHGAGIQLGTDDVRLEMTLKLSRLPLGNRHFNLTTAGRVVTRDGGLGFSPRHLALGRITVPHWILQLTGPIMVDNAWSHSAAGPFLQSLHEITIRDEAAQISYGHLDLRELSVRQTLVELGMLEDLEVATLAQIQRLSALAEKQRSLTFTKCVATAFDEARIRSRPGTAVRENRAAILALGYLLGHGKLGVFVGSNLPPFSWRAHAVFRKVTLRGRRDWTRHYLVSAALQVLSNALASHDAGLLKEELDANGGSGFSFGDLLADRAGTLLAVRSTASEQAAVAMQNQLAAGCPVDDLMPPGADLPEGLSDEILQRHYGGVGGAGYLRLLREIDRRIAACAARPEAVLCAPIILARPCPWKVARKPLEYAIRIPRPHIWEPIPSHAI